MTISVSFQSGKYFAGASVHGFPGSGSVRTRARSLTDSFERLAPRFWPRNLLLDGDAEEIARRIDGIAEAIGTLEREPRGTLGQDPALSAGVIEESREIRDALTGKRGPEFPKSG
ncbi:MAG: hypothetical protein OXN89_08540 [Bryobacterales bacterium]|nr:hypothetical protein [Bryobacterales bacterium]